MSRSEAAPDELVRTVSADGSLRVRTLVATRLVSEAMRRHQPGPTAALALGRALVGGVLLASDAQAEETLQLQFRGDGPLAGLVVIADGTARVRGFAGRPDVDVLLGGGPPDVGRAIGQGQLTVVRAHPGHREPRKGIIALESGEIAVELARYLLESEQTPSTVALGVLLASDGSVTAAGGFLAQALAGAAESLVEILEENTQALPNPSALIHEGLGADGLADRLLCGIEARPRERLQPLYHCPCRRERVLQAAALLGREELREIGARTESIEVDCEFCREHYRIDPAEAAAWLPDGRADDAG